MWIYMGIALAQHIFHLPVRVNVSLNPTYKHLLELGAVENNICFGIYQLVSMIYIFILPYLMRFISPYKVHAFSLLAGALGLISVSFTTTIEGAYIAMLGIGIVWGSVLIVPYTIITSALSHEKMGVYLGIFNMTNTIPQIICGIVVGFINDTIFFGHAILTIFLAGVLLFIAGLIQLHQVGIIKFRIPYTHKI